MKIRSKKTGLYHEVSKDEWIAMQKRNDHRPYEVIDDSDQDLMSEIIDVEPMAMFDDDDMAKGEQPPQEDFDEDEEAEYIREQLRGAEIYFHPNTGIVKLRKLYEQLWKN